MVLVAGVLFPALGTFLLLLIPPQGFVPESMIRLAMLVGAIVMPAINGGLVLWLTPAAERRQRGLPATIARGYPLTVLLAGVLVFLAVFAIVRRLLSLKAEVLQIHVRKPRFRLSQVPPSAVQPFNVRCHLLYLRIAATHARSG